MSRFSGNFFLDVVVSVATTQIASSPAKPQFDDENKKDHHFFQQNEAKKNTQKKHNLQNFFKDQLEKITNKMFLVSKQEHIIQAI